MDFFDAVETLIMLLLNMHKGKLFDKSYMPYTEAFRYKLRCWQSLIVCV